MESVTGFILKGMINDEVFSKCRKGVRVINVARGGIIDEEALVKAVESGQCAGAALDVFCMEPPTNSRLLTSERIICTPHLGASTAEAQKKVASEIAQLFVAMAEGKQIDAIVSFKHLAIFVMFPFLFHTYR